MESLKNNLLDNTLRELWWFQTCSSSISDMLLISQREWKYSVIYEIYLHIQ